MRDCCIHMFVYNSKSSAFGRSDMAIDNDGGGRDRAGNNTPNIRLRHLH